MTPQSFYVSFIILTLLVAAALLGLHAVALIAPYYLLSWVSYSFFVVFTLVIFLGGQKTAKSENKQLFSQFFLAATVIKMLTSLTIILVYFLLAKPTTQFFIIPFFFVYLCFTVFEVYFMTKLGRTDYAKSRIDF